MKSYNFIVLLILPSDFPMLRSTIAPMDDEFASLYLQYYLCAIPELTDHTHLPAFTYSQSALEVRPGLLQQQHIEHLT